MAHLRRGFQTILDRGDGSEGFGAKLLNFSGMIFASWRRDKAVPFRRQTHLLYAAGLQPIVQSRLKDGRGCGCTSIEAKFCELLGLGPWLWTFPRVEGVAPHNNLAKRGLRHRMLWRRHSCRTDSEARSQVVERVVPGGRRAGRSRARSSSFCTGASGPGWTAGSPRRSSGEIGAS